MSSILSSPKTEQQEDYRPDIDGLRAVAVLAVVIFHAFPRYLPGGFVGVDIFFVISGFLISGIIFRKLDQGAFSFFEFYKRRVRRIFPALAIVLIACLVFGWFALLPDQYKQLAGHTIGAAGFAANLQSWSEAGYFDAASDHKPLLHIWSLGIEEQFYLIWPACLVLVWSRKGKVFRIVAALAALSFAADVLLVARHPTATFYLPFTRIWELLLGSLLAYATLFQSEFPFSGISKAFGNGLGVLGAVLIVIAIAVLDKDRTFPGWWALLPTIGTVCLIAAGPDATINRTVLRHPAMVSIGLFSYPLYLWHWPLLSFARIVAKPGAALNLLLILLSALLAWATWKYVESGLRKRGQPVSRGEVFALSTGLALSGVLAAVILISNGIPGRLPARSKALLMDVTDSARGRKYAGCPESVIAGVRGLSLCVQSKPGHADAVVVGDSHAGSLFPGIAAVDQERTWLAIETYSCPPTLGITVIYDAPMCREKMNEVFNYLAGPDGPNLVVFSFFGYYAESTDYSADHVLNGRGPARARLIGNEPRSSKADVLYSGLANAIQLLVGRGKQVVLMIDVPELPFFPQDCVRRFFTRETTCYLERTEVDRRQRGLRRIVEQLQRRFPQIEVFDPLPLLCGDVRCTPVSEDFSYYKDSHHLSLRGSQRIAVPLLALINQSGS